MRVEWLERGLKNLEDEASYVTVVKPKAADDFSDAISPARTDWLSFLPGDAKIG